MKTKLGLLAFIFGSLLQAADDPHAAARTALDQNRLDDASALLAPLVGGEHPDARACFLLSQVRLRQHQTKDAIDLADKAVTAEPKNPEYQSNLGMILGQRTSEVSFMQQAVLAMRMLKAFKTSVALDPKHIPGYVGLSRYYTNAPAIAGGGREPAEQYAHQLEQLHPQLATLELANIAEHFDDPARSYELYTKAAAGDPRAGWIQEALGRLSEKLNRPTDAKSHYEKALALNPNQTGAKDALARLASAKG
jgi:tetratricopeptide (TPR) repeat protein